MSEVVTEQVVGRGKLIQVCKGDLTAENTDAIVNAANGSLSHGGGVAGAIVRRGGSQIQQESDRWVQVKGRVPTGQVAVTSAGSLSCGHVIHAVGPVWHGGDQGEEALLESAAGNALRAASDLQLESIAIPAISSGIFGFPKKRCAQILVAAARSFFDTNPTTSLKTVKFTNIDDETVRIFQQELEKQA